MKQRAALVAYCLLLSVVSFAQSLTADFRSDITAGCSPIIVNFQDRSTGNPTAWKWDFGNGSTSTRQNPSTTYFDPGTYTVTLTISTNNGNTTNTVVKTSYITVYDSPTTAFVADKQSGCSPAIIQFTDQSTTPAGTTITGWKWDFGDGNSSTERNPKYIYRRGGSYTVTLTVFTDKGCSKLVTKPNYIDITPGVAPAFNFIDPGVCSAPATINFTNASSGPGNLTYNWNLGNGTTATTPNASTTYTKNGTYRVSLLVTSDQGCTDSTSRDIEVGKATTDFTTPAALCPKTPIQFLNNSTPRPLQSKWEFSNGTTDNLRNAITSFDAPGTYTVKLINTYSVCTDTLVRTITIGAGPTVDFKAADTTRCAPPFLVNFTNNSNGTTYRWDFGDNSTASTQANPNHNYTKYGEFDVTLIATGTNGCVDTLKKSKYIKIAKPIISFPTLPTNGCIPYPFTFKANVIAVDKVTSYRWDFGDGGTSTEEKPTYTYTKQGTYNVTLTITTSTGCTETYRMEKAVKVGTKPKASFTADPLEVCASQPIQFTNTSPKPTDEWIWSFGDKMGSTEENPLHYYIDTGVLTVTLIVRNNGCGDTLIKKQLVTIKPSISRFEYRPNCNNRLQYTFTDQSIAATTWVWKVNGTTFSTSQTPPAYTFPGMGTYQVSLTTTNGNCEHTQTRTITIADNTPDFTAAIKEGCRPFSPVIVAKSPNPGLVANYSWDFGNGNIVDKGSASDIKFTYNQSGNYSIKLITTDTFGCKDEFLKTDYIRVNGPSANFTSTTNKGCVGLKTTFIDASKKDTANIVSWKWNFGDGTIQTFTSPPFEHVYDSIGDFDVKLTITDAQGCSDSTTQRGFVVVSSIKALWKTSGFTCPGAPIYFLNQTKNDIPFKSFWNFGDGTSIEDESPGKVYTDTGFYTVQLKVRDLFGCEDSMTKVNAVYVSVPKASFTANNFASYCVPFEAKFQNTSTFYNESFWDFSNGTSGQTNPYTYYTKTGTYPVKLVITSPGGCKDSATRDVKIYNPEDGNLTYSPLSGCIPATVNLEAFTEMNASFVWDMGDGNVIDTGANKLSHIYRDFGNFIPKVILREPSGTCVIPLTGKETIALKGIKAKYGIDKNFFCDSGTVRIADSTTANDPIVKYNWDFGDGTTYNVANPGQHTYTTSGLFTISFTATTQSGCTDSLKKGPVRIVLSPDISVKTDSIICVNDRILHTAVLNRPDSSGLRWYWMFPNGNTSNIQNPVPQQYVTPGTFILKAYATNPDGCADSVSRQIKVNPLPTITVPASITTQAGYPVTLPATYSAGDNTYSWAPAATLSCADCPQPIASPKFNTRYTVTCIDSNGCSNTGIVQVIVVCKNANVFVPNTFSPNGDGANDIFYVRGKGLDRVKSIRVFNRWGEIVFEQKDFPVNNPSYGWDGKYKGSRPMPDVYVYQVEVFCENSEIIRFEGNVALIQ